MINGKELDDLVDSHGGFQIEFEFSNEYNGIIKFTFANISLVICELAVNPGSNAKTKT